MALRVFEYRLTASRALERKAESIAGKFDLDHLRRIHRHLFHDVSAWAVEICTVNLRKDGVPFAKPAPIENYGAKVVAGLAAENCLEGLGNPQLVALLAHHFTEFDTRHAFREGDGRTTPEYIE
jgi:cell filamentation protein